ncbi:peptidase S8/S53 subtilisin kexin sedolisin [Citreicella sp. 357]|nr:peptidase S8/S53 subtilisin kexin sedolisin [Citreicella sp. 357]
MTDTRGCGEHFLWHLERIGALSATGPDTYEPSDAWVSLLDGAQPVRIALIDNGAVLDHPNLQESGRPCLHQPIEFAAHAQGTLYEDDPDLAVPRFVRLAEALAGIGVPDPATFFDRPLTPALKAAIDGYLAPGTLVPARIDLPAPSQRFAAHGTCCAGLLAGRPEPEDCAHRSPVTLPYFGVNPGAQVIPIATVYSHAYWPLVMALLYAIDRGADVILMPRAAENMLDPDDYLAEWGEGTPPRPRVGEDADPRGNGNFLDAARYADKALFEDLLIKIAAHVPVILAAGNSGRSTLEYPASLAAPGNALITVGAVNSHGHVASYSSGQASGPTVFAPSDDGEEISATHMRHFDLSWRARRLDLSAFDGSDGRENLYSPYGVLSTDIPGQYGYDSASRMDLDLSEGRLPAGTVADRTRPETLPRALYTLFGGTSAASAIVAGMVSLIRGTPAGQGMTGAAVKALLGSAPAAATTETRSVRISDLESAMGLPNRRSARLNQPRRAQQRHDVHFGSRPHVADDLGRGNDAHARGGLQVGPGR